MTLQMDTAWVRAARAGDPAALDAVVAEYLPLVYNIVRRSLRHSADVDDVVQETMLQLVRGVGSLRDPERLRAWVVAITVNQIRDHQRSAVRAPAPFDERLDIPDPGGEFVDYTLIQLDVSGQRRETQQAAQWLDPDHQDLLALWWLEASGHLTRPELIDALEGDPHHVAVRVSRMKEQLDAARGIVRVLTRMPRCRGLDDMAFEWDGVASSVWRKRFARHIRECPHCDAATRDLIPPERLLVGIAMLPIPAAYASLRASTVVIDVEQPKAPRRHGAHRSGKATGMAAAKPLGIAFAAIAVVAVGAVAYEGLHPKQNTVAITTTSTSSAIASSAQASPTALTVPTISASPSASAPSTSSKPTVAPTTARHTTSAPKTSAAAVVATTSTAASSNSQTAAQQVLDVINKAREQNGLKPYTMSTDLINSASAHNTRMEDGCGLSHQCSGEAALGDRETAAGVQWTSAGENIGEGGPVSNTQSSIASMAVSLTNSMLAEQPPDDGHRLNILSSSYTEVGIAVTRDSNGTVWMTQDFAGDG
ncbi:MAG TPA: sigma-70 family RNA polymerase sigma factor [Actinospica sp.]|nr:sigma-70 family RNA polymerase sigma factor [Actinospica sp.]